MRTLFVLDGGKDLKVTDYIAEILNENGVTTIFGYQGSSIAHLIDSISRHPGMKFVETRHEQGAAFAANGYALGSGKLGVAVACSGPGAINLIGGIADAYYDSLPCLFITGQVSQKEMRTRSDMRQNGFQETDIISMVTPITKYAVSISKADDVKRELLKAVKIAVSLRQGPVLIDIPHNIQNAQIEYDVKIDASEEFVKAEYDVYKIIGDIESSERPIFIFGGGIRELDEEYVDLLSDLSIPVVTSYRGKDRFDNNNCCYCGTIGVYGQRNANWAVRYSDCIVCFGSRLDGRQTAGESLNPCLDKKITVIDIDSCELSKFDDSCCKICADAYETLEDILLKLKKSINYRKWLRTIKGWEKRYPILNEYHISEGVNPNKLLNYISLKADGNASFTIDVGQNQLWANTSMVIGRSQKLIQSCGLGAMGFSLPAAIGVFFARGTQTICVTGDGGLQMNIQELQTVKEYNIEIVIVLMNNNALGLIRDYQDKALAGRHYGSVDGFGSPNYEQIAKAYGLNYVRISDESYRGMLDHVLSNHAPCLIEVDISQQSTAYPEPTYGSTIVDQSIRISQTELEKIKEEAYGCR